MSGKKMQLSVAQKMVSDYNNACGDEAVHSFTVDAAFLQSIISQKGCAKVRFFVGLESGLPPKGAVGLPLGHTLVAVGTDSQGKNMINGEDDSEVYEYFDKCPVICNDGNGYTL